MRFCKANLRPRLFLKIRLLRRTPFMSRNTTHEDVMPTSLFPSSREKYITGGRADVRVPIREISLSPTYHSKWVEQNPPVPVYDCSGPYTDPDVEIDLARGLPALRGPWIEEREDTERLTQLSSEYGRQRQNDLLTHDLRFTTRARPRRARRGLNVSQLHYARKGIITPEMEFIALREPMQLDRLAQDPSYALLLRQHRGEALGAQFPKGITPGATLLTDIFGAQALASARVSMTTPAFEAQ